MLLTGGVSTGIVLSLMVGIVLRTRRKRVTSLAPKDTSTLASEEHTSLQRKRFSAWWVRPLLYRSGLVLALLLVYGLFASFALAQTTLQHVDPVVFTALQLAVCLPVAVALLGWTFRPATSASVRLGCLGGIPLGLGFVCIALSLRTLGIIPTAMLTALDGVMASGISWIVFRQPTSLFTCLAAACASIGALLLWWIAPSQWQMDLVALSCGLLFTLYAFHVEQHAIAHGSLRHQLLPFFGGLFSSMALTALVLALCFGQWGSLQFLNDTDLGILLYCGLATSLVPQVILTLLLRHMSAVSLAFCAILEPLASLGVASWRGALSLDVPGLCGVSLIFLSLLLQANASRMETCKQHQAPGEQTHVQEQKPVSHRETVESGPEEG